jgi:hypothetical protein
VVPEGENLVMSPFFIIVGQAEPPSPLALSLSLLYKLLRLLEVVARLSKHQRWKLHPTTELQRRCQRFLITSAGYNF